MKQFLRFSFLYLMASSALAVLFRDNPGELFDNVMHLMTNGAVLVALMALGLLSVGMGVNAWLHITNISAMALRTAQAAIAIVFFQAGFVIFKTTMPFIVPFYADPFFAQVDAWLHFGTTPWRLAHAVDKPVLIETLAGIYLKGWLWVALLLPLVLATLDNNPRRVRNMLILYVSSWVLLGNILALIGMSAGPIYYDRLYETPAFHRLTEAFLSSGPNMQAIRTTQESLWFAYSELAQTKGSGISAFPSVHVSVATVAGIYLFERCAWAWPIAITGCAAILFMSVYTGYHYAIDGYVSIVTVVGVWLYLRHHTRSERQLH